MKSKNEATAPTIDVIDTGLVEFPLNFDRGLVKIYFNPNEPEFFLRISEMINTVSDVYEKYENKYATTQDGTEKLKVIKDVGEEIKELFDIAFGNKVSDGIFKFVSPHGYVKSKKMYFSFYILEILRGMIEKEIGETSEMVSEALKKANNKHTQKYAHKLEL